MNNHLIPTNKKNNFNFSHFKNNATCSLFEVENFLCNFKKTTQYLKLYNILKHFR